MELTFKLSGERSRFGIGFTLDEFDGSPGLEQAWFDGINEPVTPDAAVLAGWLLAAPFVSQRLRLSCKPSRLLVNRIAATWGAPIEIGPVDDKPARFPARTGTLFVMPAGSGEPDSAGSRSDQPAYRLRQLPLNASGTIYAGPEISIRTNVSLLGQGLVPASFAQLVAPALIYADFLGIADLVVPREAIDVPPPMKRSSDTDPLASWRELLKAAGFNLRVGA
ncbi:MAG TPA: hypothetical protein VF267_07610 [Gammaproteobacteria bacterium]